MLRSARIEGGDLRSRRDPLGVNLAFEGEHDRWEAVHVTPPASRRTTATTCRKAKRTEDACCIGWRSPHVTQKMADTCVDACCVRREPSSRSDPTLGSAAPTPPAPPSRRVSRIRRVRPSATSLHTRARRLHACETSKAAKPARRRHTSARRGPSSTLNSS